MNRNEYLKGGLLAGISALFLGFNKSFSSTNELFENTENKSLRRIEGVLSPTNTHMVGNGFKVMNYFPNGKGLKNKS